MQLTNYLLNYKWKFVFIHLYRKHYLWRKEMMTGWQKVNHIWGPLLMYCHINNCLKKLRKWTKKKPWAGESHLHDLAYGPSKYERNTSFLVNITQYVRSTWMNGMWQDWLLNHWVRWHNPLLPQPLSLLYKLINKCACASERKGKSEWMKGSRRRWLCAIGRHYPVINLNRLRKTKRNLSG